MPAASFAALSFGYYVSAVINLKNKTITLVDIPYLDLMKLLLTILIILLSLNSYSQKLPGRQEQNEFLQWYIQFKKFTPVSDTTGVFDYNYKNEYSLSKIVLSSLKLSKASNIYIKKQIRLSKKEKLDTIYFKNINWAKTDTAYQISYPIYSASKKIVLISWGYSCGFDCGKSGIEVYVRVSKGRWRPSKIWMPYIIH